MKKQSTKKLVLAALFLALAYLLPFLTGQIPEIGSMLLPMHLPVLICGFVCGWPYGLAVGFAAPLLRSFTLGMPPPFPTAVAMAFELAAYGVITGICYKKLPKKPLFLYVDILAAMIGGRIVWGAAMMICLGIKGGAFTWSAFLSGSVLSAIPGIVLQLILVPIIVAVLQKAKLIPDDQ